MKILGLVGSPRKGGNTDILVDAVLHSAQSKDNTIDKVYLYDVGIDPCIDCRGCKKGDLVCVLKDGMKELYPRLDEAHAIVFGTPVYWLGPSGVMKNFVDRLRPYFSNGLMKGKKAVLVAPAKAGPPEGDLLTEMFRRSFNYLDVEFVGCALGSGYDKKDVLKDKHAMDKATELGSML